MTADELVQELVRLSIGLDVRGEALHIKAPAGAMTPELLADLATHKPALIARFAAVREFVSLKGGLVVPFPALKLAVDLEARGFRMSLDACDQFTIESQAALTDVDHVAIHRWRQHLAAIINYQCPEDQLPQ